LPGSGRSALPYPVPEQEREVVSKAPFLLRRKRVFLLAALLGLLLIPLLLLLPAWFQDRRATPAPSFALTNQFGQMTSLSQLKGKVVVLTFLYTYCPTVCPLYITKIKQALVELGSPGAAEVTVVAVTVDPDRDTVETLQRYTSAWSPQWLYLTGKPRQLKLVWDNYGIYVEKREPKMTMGGQSHTGHYGYEVIHTAKVVVIDKEGFRRSELVGDWQATELAEKLRRLLSGQEIAPEFRPWQSFISFLYRCGPISISSLGGAVAHFAFMLTFPIGAVIVLYLLWR
jgi:protein SCO1/2